MEDIRTLRLSVGLSQADIADMLGKTEKTISRWETGKNPVPKADFEWLRDRIMAARAPRRDDFTFVDLFAGIGGIRKGFENVGGTCVFTSEWDKYARQTYQANFGADHPIAGDIVAIPSEVIPKHDVLLAGFPCQPFSIAGVSKKNSLGRAHGFACDTQGTLFFEVARILKHHRPKAFLLENVKNLKSHDGGRTFEVIMRTLKDELGYSFVEAKVIDARAFVPQHRERILIVGFRDSTPFDWNDVVIPQGPAPTLASILHPEDGSEAPEDAFLTKDGKVLPKYTLTKNLWVYLQEYAAKHKAKGNGFGFGLFGPNDVARTLSARYYKDGSEVLISRGTRSRPRRLTPRECARLMGFDSSFDENDRMVIPVSDMQAYKQFGNSVAVPVITAVARAMHPHIVDARLAAVQRDQLSLPLRLVRSA